MSVITTVPEPNVWEEICKEANKQRPPFIDEEDEDARSDVTEYINYNPAIHNPVFYGAMFARVSVDADVYADFDPAISHPSCVGYSFCSKPQHKPQTPAPMPPNRFMCSPAEYLNHYVFPLLLPALEAMLKQAKVEKCFEEHVVDEEDIVGNQCLRRRNKFNACDFITEFLYKNNANAGEEGRKNMGFLDIPFVQDWVKDHPRPPLPKSLIWSEEEASLIIQSFWRGYRVRCDPEVQEMRAWQREWREENRGIQNRVAEFWQKVMPEESEVQESHSETTFETTPDE